MQRFATTILLATLLFAARAEASQLLRVARLDSGETIQIYLYFDSLPQFNGVSSDRRIDILLPGSSQVANLPLFPTDQHIVKILPRREGETLILSLFFRYRPQRYTLTASGSDQLVLEVLPGNEFSKSNQELSERLKGISLLDRPTVDLANPLRISPYAGNWLTFFVAHESPVDILPPVRFTSPPFPLVRLLPPAKEKNLDLFPPRVLAQAAAADWDQVAAEIVQLNGETTDYEQKKLLALSYGEVLGRKGTVPEAAAQLSQLKKEFGNELLGSFASFLLLQLQANHGDPYLASAAYGGLEKVIGKENPLAPYLLLARVETALATGNHNLLNQLLQRDDIGLPPEVAEALQVRQADYWFAINQPVKAYAGYRLRGESPTLANCPFSLNGRCSTLYQMKEFSQASQCYQKLAGLLKDPEKRGLALYRQHLSGLHSDSQQSDITSFSRLESTYGKQQAGLLAALKRTDLEYLHRGAQSNRAAESYRTIAAAATTNRHIREEALFKEALVLSLQGDNTQAIARAGEFLREFGSGPVRISAQALLIQLLPGEIQRLVAAREYFDALVLVKQHGDLFQNGWIDSSLLLEVADAYQRLGIYQEAQKLYLYILETSSPENREQLYLPLITAAFEQGEYLLVDDYAAQYQYLYPQGKDSEDILLYRLEALRTTNQVNAALRLLPEPLPASLAYQQLAISLFFRTDAYARARQLLEDLARMAPLSPLEQFMLAESLYQTGAFAEAEETFSTLGDDHPFAEKSLFRQAQLAKRNGDEKKALSLWQKIVETGKNTGWKELAERELQFTRLSGNL